MSPRAKSTARSSLAPSAEPSMSEENLCKVRALVEVSLGKGRADKDGLVSAVDAIFVLLLELDLAYYANIDPKRVGVHPTDRYG